MEFGDVFSRQDGTYVVQLNGMPYHVIPSSPFWDNLMAHIEANPDKVVPEPMPEPEPYEPPDPPETPDTLTSDELGFVRGQMAALGYVEEDDE